MRDARNLYRFWGSTPPGPQAGRHALVRADVSSTETSEATLYLYGPIDSWGGMWGVSAAEVADALTTLPAGTTDLNVRINSPGGEVFEAVAIMNLLRGHSARIIARVDGLAASAASFLAVSADETIMGRNTELMIHDAWGIAIGNAADMHQYGDLLDRLSNDIAEVYDAKAGGGVDGWRNYMLAESWFNAEEAVSLGLADSVAGETDTTETESDTAAAASMQYDTAALFTYAGRAAAPEPAPLPAASAQDPLQAATIALAADADRRRRHQMRARAHNH